MAWLMDPIEIGRILQAGGFDLDPDPVPARTGAGSISGRLVRGDRVVTIAVDSGGRARTTVSTRSEGPAQSTRTAAGLELVRIATDVHEETVVGRLRCVGDLEMMLAIAISTSDAPT